MGPSEFHSLNGVDYSGQNQTQAVDSGLSQSEAFPPLSPDCSDVAREHDIMLPIKGECMWTLEALCSDLWLWALGLSCGDRCSEVDRKAGLSFRDIVSVSKGKNAFMPFLLLSLLRPPRPCTATTSQLRRSRVFVFELKPPASSLEALNVL